MAIKKADALKNVLDKANLGRGKKTASKKLTTTKKVVVKKVVRKKLTRKIAKKETPASRTVAKLPPQILFRHYDNPIIEPRDENFWEMKATFNPAAVYADERVHLLYRAIGGSDVSVLGYASSKDGITITERLDQPAFVPILKNDPSKADATQKTGEAGATGEKALESAPVPAPMPAYCSGGGWNGGSEDPRLTLIDDQVYLTYTAFDGWGSIRIALTSIALPHFLDKKWTEWKEPMLLSPAGEINKNWVLFPEKINGKFAILHSISPNILVDYFDDLDHFAPDENVINSRYDRSPRTGAWDSWIRGAGPPPLRTKLGWLLFYHAMDVRDPNRYKLGAMILDINDPTKILYRSRRPILEPDAHYENQGFKSGVVYSCGAVIKDGELYVYYGGGDSVSCVAMANADAFVDHLKKYGTAELTPRTESKASAATRSRNQNLKFS